MNTPVGARAATAGHAAADGADESGGDRAASSSQINLSWTASTDNVGVTGYLVERCQGAGCTNFAQIATPTGDDVQRQRACGEHELQLPGARDGCGRQPQRLLQHRQRDDAGGCRTRSRRRRRANLTATARLEQPDQSELDGLDGQRRGDGLSGGALPGRGVCELRADRDAAGDDVQRHRAGGGTRATATGCGRRMRRAT